MAKVQQLEELNRIAAQLCNSDIRSFVSNIFPIDQICSQNPSGPSLDSLVNNIINKGRTVLRFLPPRLREQLSGIFKERQNQARAELLEGLFDYSDSSRSEDSTGEESSTDEELGKDILPAR